MVELALALTREDGQLHALLPTTALAAPYAAQMQQRILGETLMGMIQMSEEAGFDGAEVEVVGLVLQLEIQLVVEMKNLKEELQLCHPHQ